MKTHVILLTSSYSFFISSNITLHKKIKRNLYRLWSMFHMPFRNHVSTILLYLELVSKVYPDENHQTVVRLWLYLPLVQVCCHRSAVCLCNHNSQKDLGTRLKHSPMYTFFFQFWHCGYFTDGPKTVLPQPKRKHMQGALLKQSM